MKYEYLTETLPYGVSRKKLTEKLQALITEKAKDGWRVVNYAFSDWLGACVIVFEKEARY